MAERDLGQRQARRFAFRNGTLDFLAGWCLGYAQLGGLSPGSAFEAFGRVGRGGASGWVASFGHTLADEQRLAARAHEEGNPRAAAQHDLAVAVAARAQLHFADLEAPETRGTIAAMEESFQRGVAGLGYRLDPVSVPFGAGHLPGYVSAGFASLDVLVVVVGGGDTYREDLFFMGGKGLLDAGYAVAMIDYPGQGTVPYQGLHFGTETVEGLDTALKWLRTQGFAGRFVLLGWSGGGLFTAKYLSLPGHEPVAAWIASTPIVDFATLAEVGMPAILRKRPDGRLASTLLALAGRMSRELDLSLRKYTWQFGPQGIAGALEQARTVGIVDVSALDTPVLALAGASESPEAIRQAKQAYEAVRIRRPGSRHVVFERATGADAHCQVNNLPLATATMLDWLDGLGLTPGPVSG